ncbi:hypothetical protein [Algoriphagus boritolerans]|uniref:hypothetical protein n=1 Tax=Algoriphagus boritolerans TaxID=308111 RepID=UPI000A703E33
MINKKEMNQVDLQAGHTPVRKMNDRETRQPNYRKHFQRMPHHDNSGLVDFSTANGTGKVTKGLFNSLLI